MIKPGIGATTICLRTIDMMPTLLAAAGRDPDDITKSSCCTGYKVGEQDLQGPPRWATTSFRTLDRKGEARAQPNAFFYFSDDGDSSWSLCVTRIGSSTLPSARRGPMGNVAEPFGEAARSPR